MGERQIDVQDLEALTWTFCCGKVGPTWSGWKLNQNICFWTNCNKSFKQKLNTITEDETTKDTYKQIKNDSSDVKFDWRHFGLIDLNCRCQKPFRFLLFACEERTTTSNSFSNVQKSMKTLLLTPPLYVKRLSTTLNYDY